VSFQHGDPTWTAYRERAKSDLYWLASTVLGYGELVPMTPGAHQLLCHFVQRTTKSEALNTARYRKIELARGWGKSTVVTRAYAIQRLLQDPNTAILIANEKEQTAVDFLAEIKAHFETNPFLRALFPELIPADVKETTWSATRIILNRPQPRPEPSIAVIGVGGTVTGAHPDCIIIDDAISREAMENARAGSWDVMHKVNRWIHQLVPLLNPNAKPFPELTFIGTRWWYGDCYEHLEDHFGYGEAPVTYALRLKLPSGEVQQVPAYRLGDLAVFRRPAIEDGRSAFPEKWSLEDLAKIRLGDEVLFSCNYLLNPADNVTATFKEGWLHYFDWLDEQTLQFTDGAGAQKLWRVRDLDILVFVDPGGFTQRAADQRARAAICVTGSTGTGEHLLLEAASEPDTFLAAIRNVVSLVSRYQPRKLVVELAGQQAAFIELLRKALQEAGLVIALETVTPGMRQKEQRILQLEPWFQRGHIYIGRTAAYHEFRTQYSQFPRAARFDLLDALSYAPAVWKKQPGAAQQSPADRRAQELSLYRAKRGLRA
jgi:terminase large subunit-like protein